MRQNNCCRRRRRRRRPPFRHAARKSTRTTISARCRFRRVECRIVESRVLRERDGERVGKEKRPRVTLLQPMIFRNHVASISLEKSSATARFRDFQESSFFFFFLTNLEEARLSNRTRSELSFFSRSESGLTCKKCIEDRGVVARSENSSYWKINRNLLFSYHKRAFFSLGDEGSETYRPNFTRVIGVWLELSLQSISLFSSLSLPPRVAAYNNLIVAFAFQLSPGRASFAFRAAARKSEL